jgi:FdhD protein
MKYQKKAPFPETGSMRTLEAIRLEGPRGRPEKEECQVPVEEALSLAIEGIGTFTLMCTPTDTVPLAAGFALTEGIIESGDDIASISECMETPGVIRLILKDPASVDVGKRNLIVSSSCSLCGGRETVADIFSRISPVPSGSEASLDFLLNAIHSMRSRQTLFRHTGGTHGAALLDREGAIMALAEDVGRHNALDKAIGKCLLGKIPTAGGIATLSSRLSLEMVAKAAKAGLEIVAGVSAATSLAVRAAERFNITLCGFARDDRITIFAHPKRITSGD